MSRHAQLRDIYFVSGDIFNIVTGGSLCDRMIVDELQKNYRIQFIVPHPKNRERLRWPLLAGLINNLRNVFRRFPRGSLVFIDHGVYRDCFIAANIWKWLYRCRIVGLVYHLEYQLPEVRGGKDVRRAIETLLVRVYDYVLTISRSTADHLRKFGFPPDDMALIPVSRRFGPQEYLDRVPLDNLVKFLFVGSIEPRKGLLDAVEALGAYRGAKRIVFQCVGTCDREGAYFRDLSASAEKFSRLSLEVPGAVSQEDLVGYFRSADAFLFASHWEGYGIAIEEAMCFALPVIAYHAGAVPELVEDGVTGWLAPAGDVASLAGAVTECMEDSQERQRRGRRGLVKANETTNARNLPAILATAISQACA